MKTSPRLRRLYNRFAASTRGVAAIEFAMILPVLATLFLATFDGGRALAAYMKVRAATYALASIANQYTTIASDGHDHDRGRDFHGDGSVYQFAGHCHDFANSRQQRQQCHGRLELLAQGHRPTPRRYASDDAADQSVHVRHLSLLLIFAQVSYTYTPLFGFFTSGAINFRISCI